MKHRRGNADRARAEHAQSVKNDSDPAGMIFAWRMKEGLTHFHAAVKFGCDIQTVRKLERGYRTSRFPSLRLAIALRDIVGVPIDAWIVAEAA